MSRSPDADSHRDLKMRGTTGTAESHVGPVGGIPQAYSKRVRRKREKPFAAEYALLAELGLRRS
jgi:hypothetical protein